MTRVTIPTSRSARWLCAGLLGPLVALAVASCGDPPPSEYPEQVAYVEDTTLGPADVFEVRVFDHEELSTTYTVNTQGTIAFPHIGDVSVAGKSPSQVEKEIRERLADGYLRNPQVSIQVKEYNSKKVSVFGQVRKPGTLSFREGMTIVMAVSDAGGFTSMARRNAVTVTRAQNEKKTKYTVPVERIGKGQARDFFLRPGDVVFVPERLF